MAEDTIQWIDRSSFGTSWKLGAALIAPHLILITHYKWDAPFPDQQREKHQSYLKVVRVPSPLGPDNVLCNGSGMGELGLFQNIQLPLKWPHRFEWMTDAEFWEKANKLAEYLRTIKQPFRLKRFS